MKILFLDLKREYKTIKSEIDSAVNRVISSGRYILGSEVEELENAFASYIKVKYAIGVGSGTEALHLALLASGIKPKDEAITSTNTCAPTISAIIAAGAIPVLIDADPLSYCLDVLSVEKKITRRTKAIIPVHLYGHTADMDQLIELGRKYDISIIEDCAQAHGARYKNKMAGSIGTVGAFSFYPTKNMGALGDGGMITTNSKKIADKCRLLRNYGQKNRYKHSIPGFNSRLDELQAAILKVKLKKLDEWNMKRRAIAEQYNKGIHNPNITLPFEGDYVYHVYHLYVIQVNLRRSFRDFLAKQGISSLIHYPIPIHHQKFYVDQYESKADFPVADTLSKRIVSLPLYPYLNKTEVEHIIKVVNSYQA